LIEVEILSGKNKGSRHSLPKIGLKTQGTTTIYSISIRLFYDFKFNFIGSDLPFTLYRYQFPIKLAFVMSINKSQGQTFKKVGIYLPSPVFAHGQLYVAFSRTSKFENVRVKIKNYSESKHFIKGNSTFYSYFTKNIVYNELLE